MPDHAATDRAAGTLERSRTSFCSMPFDPIHAADVLGALQARPTDRPFVYVTTPNVDHVVRLRRGEASLLSLYEDAWMTVCDSRVLAALSRVAGDRLPVTTGADLTGALLGGVIAPSDPVNVVGADADVVRRLQARYPLGRVNHHAPPMGLNERPREIARCVEFIERHPARFTFIAVGSPQQEKIAHEVWRRGKATGVGLCIGNALMFSAGVTPRAPLWMQRLSLEWLHRLTREPGRLTRRYLVDDMLIVPMFSRHLLTVAVAAARDGRADARAASGIGGERRGRPEGAGTRATTRRRGAR